MATVHLIGTRDETRESAPGADEQGDARASLGDWLRQAREARGLTLDGITQETRIPRRHLEAIEHGDLGALPDFYQRAEVRAFARVVGVDEQSALARLQSADTPEQPQASGGHPPPVRRLSTVYRSGSARRRGDHCRGTDWAHAVWCGGPEHRRIGNTEHATPAGGTDVPPCVERG